MKRIGNNHVSFFGERSYDNAGNPLKPMRNFLAELGYTMARRRSEKESKTEEKETTAEKEKKQS